MYTAVFHVLLPRKPYSIHKNKETNKLQEK